MNTAHEPRLLRMPGLGMVLEVQVGRKWSHVIARDARTVYVKRVANVVCNAAREISYPKGIEEAASHFLNPVMGIAQVTPAAKLILESIINDYQNSTGE